MSSKHILEAWGWNEAHRALPYSVACLVLALMMVPAGRMQDRVGPRWMATAGGVLVGIGLMISSRFTSLRGLVLGFGVLAGTGIGLGYASATPPAVKWFPPQMTGLIAGIVVAGFGLAFVYIAALAESLLNAYGVSKSLFIFGVAFLISVTLLAQVLRGPSRVTGSTSQVDTAQRIEITVLAAKQERTELGPLEMLRTPQFYLLWSMFISAGGAGLMIIRKTSQDLPGSGGYKSWIPVGGSSGRWQCFGQDHGRLPLGQDVSNEDYAACLRVPGPPDVLPRIHKQLGAFRRHLRASGVQLWSQFIRIPIGDQGLASA
ncbi:MAG: MFS transporter [Thermodesulfobacteriota bacterium]